MPNRTLNAAAHKDWCDLTRPEYTGGCTCTLNDGFGNLWEKCDHEDCALEIVRPGKVQCSRCQHGDEQPLRNVDG